MKASAMDDCFMAVKRLKEGPPNMKDIICNSKLFKDATFSDRDSIFYPSMKAPFDTELFASLDQSLNN